MGPVVSAPGVYNFTLIDSTWCADLHSRNRAPEQRVIEGLGLGVWRWEGTAWRAEQRQSLTDFPRRGPFAQGLPQVGGRAADRGALLHAGGCRQLLLARPLPGGPRRLPGL